MLLNFIPILYPNNFSLGNKALCNEWCSVLNNCFDFQEITYSLSISSFKRNALNTGW